MLGRAFEQCARPRRLPMRLISRADCDISTERDVRLMFDRYLPSLVINCAAFTNVDQSESDPAKADATNVLGIGHLARSAQKHDALLVHFSTDYVFDGTHRRAQKPDDETGPRSAYGRSKLAGERAMQEGTLKHWLIIRTSWLYGPKGPNFVQTMLNAARAGKPITVVDDQIGSPTFTHDLAGLTLDLIDRGATGIYHATNSGQTTWFEFAKAIFEEFEIPNVDLKPISSAKWRELKPASAIRPAYSVLDCRETEKLIGRSMPDWREALHRYRRAIEESEPDGRR
ncbi:MAG: dTDP-4-dehydrorhamnose reductase [Anaerolineae bacterium]|nr:dTDP-4-dehydrorhamnose reductase [Phycisphaerae bacterium]